MSFLEPLSGPGCVEMYFYLFFFIFVMNNLFVTLAAIEVLVTTRKVINVK